MDAGGVRGDLSSTANRLFHFSEDPHIKVFEPRPVATPVDRGHGREWLNGPLVWAIDEHHQFLYWFPRECPRILIWPTEATSECDRTAWFGSSSARAIAFVEGGWQERLRVAAIHRYELPTNGFEDIADVGMWVSHDPVRPILAESLDDLPTRLRAADIELRVLDRLTSLRPLWSTSLHASGLRLRNAIDWGEPGWLRSTSAAAPSV